MADNETNVDVTLQEDQYSNGSDWSDEEENDQENLPPPKSTFVNKDTHIRSTNLDPIKEESRISFSRYSQQYSDDKNSDEMTQRTQAPTPATYARTTSKESISFGSDSFGKLDDLEKVLAVEEEDCHKRNIGVARPDISHDKSKIHSWEPSPTDLNLTKMSIPQNSFSKPITSTPIAGRVPGRFDAGVSEIQDMSQVSARQDSTLSSTRVNYLIKDVRMEQSSFENARKFVHNAPPSYARRVPKNSVLLDELKKNRDLKNSRLQTSNSNPAKPQNRANYFLPTLPPLTERNAERDSVTSSNRPSRTYTEDAAEIAIKPSPLSHWGFVAIGEEVQSKIYVKNMTNHILEIIPKLGNNVGAFKLASNRGVQIHPNCFHEFIVIFSPTENRRYRQKVRFCVASSGKSYIHTLLGYGGTADVKIIEKRSLAYFPRSGVYRFSSSDVTAFGFDVENIGARSAFVHIVPCDDIGNETRQITVTPESFSLASKDPDGNSNPDAQQKITVKVSDQYMQQMNRSRFNVYGSSSSLASTKNCFLTLKIYFGDERLRQRASRFSEENNCHQTYRGLLLTKTPFLLKNESSVVIKDNDPVSMQDIEMLKAQTRVLTLIVGDDRIGSSRPSTSFSQHHRSVAATAALDNGYYIPECENEGDATMMSVACSERTLMK